jgi:hypothetical protein
MAGARMLTNYPTSIIVHGMALNITVQSYDRSLDFGLMADAQAMPDVHELAQALRVAMDDLRALPRPGEPDPEAPTAEWAVSRATRKFAGGIGGAISGSPGGAQGGGWRESAVSRVTSRPIAASSQTAACWLTWLDYIDAGVPASRHRRPLWHCRSRCPTRPATPRRSPSQPFAPLTAWRCCPPPAPG